MNAPRRPHSLSGIQRRSRAAAVVMVAAALIVGSIAGPADAATHKQRTRVSMSLSATAVASGEVVTVSGKLSAKHAKLKGQKVSVQFMPSGGKRWHTTWVGHVNRAGQVSHAFPIKAAVSVQIKFLGSRTLKSSVSTSKFISVPQHISVTSVTPALSPIGQTVTLVGTATPSLVGTIVKLQRRTVGSSAEPARLAVSTIAADGSFVLTDTPTEPGVYSYRATSFGGGVTGERKVTVYSALSAAIKIDTTSPSSLTLGDQITVSGFLGAGFLGKILTLQRTSAAAGSMASTVGTATVNNQGRFSFRYTPTQLGAAQYQVNSADLASSSAPVTFTVSSWFSLPSRADFFQTKDAEIAGASFATANQIGGDIMEQPATSEFSYDLHGACTMFDASLGVDDWSSDGARLTFTTVLDGSKVADVSNMTTGEVAKHVSLDLSGAQNFSLENTYSHPTLNEFTAFADWANAKLYCSAAPN